MSDQARSQRKYSDKQVALILQRAAEISARESPTSGATLEDLERIAAEAGLDPAAVRRAAAEVESGATSPTGWRAVLGGPTRILFETRLDGELPASAHEHLAELLQRHLPAGTPAVIGRTFTWQTASPQGRHVAVSVSSRHGSTSVRIEEPLANVMGGVFGGVGGGVGGSLTPLVALGATALLGPTAIGPAIAVSLLGTFVLSRAIYGAVTRRREVALRALFDELHAVVAEDVVRGRSRDEVRAEDLEAVRARTLPSRDVGVAEKRAAEEQKTVDEVIPGLRRR